MTLFSPRLSGSVPCSARHALSLALSFMLACGGDAAPSPGDETPDHHDSPGSDAAPGAATASGAGKLDGSVRASDGGTRPLDSGTSMPGKTPPAPADAGGKSPSGTSGDAGSPHGDAQADGSGASAPRTFADSTLIPHASWTCNMPDGIPAPGSAPVVFTAALTISNIRELGQTQFGRRQLIELGAGTFDGPKLKATLQPGGLDQPVVLANGAIEIEQILTLKTSDGGYVYLRVCGTAPDDSAPARVVMDFEAPSGGAYDFLNTTKLVGTREVDVAGKKLTLRVHDVSSLKPSSDSITIANPDAVPNQSWDCQTGKGTAGKDLYREVVNIGGSLSVGASKRGTRNIIPITGGTATGRIQGSVLAGGGDFQILDTGFVLDARYTLLSNDKELIIVRNCGPADSLVPVFEARSDGPYGYLNTGTWLSSTPQIGLGTVTIQITEAN